MPSSKEWLLSQALDVWGMLPLVGLRGDKAYRKLMLKSATSGHVDGTWVSNAFELAKIVRLCRDNWNIYIQLNPSREKVKIKASASDIAYVQAILIDIDPLPSNVDNLPSDYWNYWTSRALELVLEHGVLEEQVAVIDSGRGRQLWVLIDPLGGDNSRIVRRIPPFVRAVASEFADACPYYRIDTSCTDIARVARMPGSINHKTGCEATILKAAKPGPWTWLRDNFEPDPEPDAVEVCTPVNRWQDLIPRLNNRASNFILLGESTPGRHAGAFCAARSLREAGATKEQALFLVSMGASRCIPPLEGDWVRIVEREFPNARGNRDQQEAQDSDLWQPEGW